MFIPIIFQGLYIPGGWEWDFWTINRYDKELHPKTSYSLWYQNAWSSRSPAPPKLKKGGWSKATFFCWGFPCEFLCWNPFDKSSGATNGFRRLFKIHPSTVGSWRSCVFWLILNVSVNNILESDLRCYFRMFQVVLNNIIYIYIYSRIYI